MSQDLWNLNVTLKGDLVTLQHLLKQLETNSNVGTYAPRFSKHKFYVKDHEQKMQDGE
jgi:hypothetical protein